MPERTTPGGSIPSKSDKSMVLDRFRGADLTSSVVNVDKSRSPNAPNMMPDADGYPAKRTGYETVTTLEGKVYGHYALSAAGVSKQLIHAGKKLYLYEDDPAEATVIWEDMAEDYSMAMQLEEKLWILDGKTYLYFDGQTAGKVSDIATVPMITISKTPDGKSGATSYQPINLLTGRRTDSYLGTEDAKDYFLSFTDLTSDPVTAKVLGTNGSWNELAEGSGITVDRELGKVTFAAAPGKSPVTGEDNVRITYTCAGHADEINACRFGILYGVNGAMDRVFLSGNPDKRNVDWWSEYRDPSYLGDTFYATLGQESSAIVGYSILNNYLVTHKENEENERNIFVRRGTTDEDGFGLFQIQNIIQGDSCVSWRTCKSVSSEPDFLTARGVAALTASDITGERYSQNRSWYINGVLKQMEGLKDACAVIWGQFYVLSAGPYLFLLDSEQKSYEAREPYSTYQYESYYFTGIQATSLWVDGETLWFGTAGGAVRRFKKKGRSDAYNDDGAAYDAAWCTPMMDLGIWSNLKNITSVWVVLQPYARSGADVYYASDKSDERLVRSVDVDILDWNDVDFDRWTFSSLDRPSVNNVGKRERKVKLFQVCAYNRRLNEPMGIYAIHINYKVGGKVKRR